MPTAADAIQCPTVPHALVTIGTAIATHVLKAV